MALDPALKIPAAIRALLAVVGVSVAFVGGVLVLLRPEKEVTAAIIAAAATVLGGALSVAVGRYYEKSAELEIAVREKKLPVYEDFIRFWFGVLYASKLQRKSPTQTEMLKSFVTFTETLTIWGSDDVVREWGSLRNRFAELAAEPSRARETMFEFEQLLLAIRRDSGYPNTALRRGDVLRLFVDDIEAW